jgi:hypothetical protein
VNKHISKEDIVACPSNATVISEFWTFYPGLLDMRQAESQLMITLSITHTCTSGLLITRYIFTG